MPSIHNAEGKGASAAIRPSLLRGSSIGLALAAAAIAASPAQAANECGTPTAGTVTCTTAGNPFTTGITYAPAGDLTLITNSDVAATNTIRVNGGGTTTITNNGSVATTRNATLLTSGATGVFVRGTTGVVITGNGEISTSGRGSRGIDAAATGTGPVTINVGNVTTTGGNNLLFDSSAIVAVSNSGAINITAGNLATASTLSNGVRATSTSGPITVSTGSITTTGALAAGISATSNGTGAVVIGSSGTVTTSGLGSTGLNAIAVNGTATVNANDVNISGDGANGITAIGGLGANATFGTINSDSTAGTGVLATATGNVVVSGANVATQANLNSGIIANSSDGDATVSTTGTVSTLGTQSRAISASAALGTATVNAVDVSTVGDDSQAILATGANAVVNATGTVSTAGTRAILSNGDAITVNATAGNASATVNNVSATGIASTTGGASVTPRALVVTASDAANATINGAVNSTNGDAVILTGDTTSATVASTGSVNGGVNGVQLNGLTSASLNNAGTITAGTGTAVDAFADQVTIVNTGSISGANGIYAAGYNGVSITGSGSISANGTIGGDGRGISAYSAGDGPITINVGDVTTTGLDGDNTAILALTDSGAINITAGNVSTQGNDADGVSAFSNTGPINVSTGSVTTAGDSANGIFARSDTDGAVVIGSTGTVSTAGQGSVGLYAVANYGTATVNANNVGATGDNSAGIVAFGALGANVTFGNVNVTGDNSAGVFALTSTGDVVVSGANVTASGDNNQGITGFADAGNVTISTTGSVATSGVGSRGIYAYSETGTTTVNANNVSTLGDDSQAIVAIGANAIVNSTGTVSTAGTSVYSDSNDAITAIATDGNATATVNNVSATGAGTPRALVVTATGAATANINGAVRSTNGDAVVLTGDTVVANVARGGSVIGGVNGLVLDGTTSSTLTNAGTIGSGATGYAVVATLSPASITNSGTINGRILLSGGNDTLTNSGTFNATGVSDFGAGNDTLNNSGTFNSSAIQLFGAGNDVVNNSGTFNTTTNLDFGTGTDTFNNSGRFNVRPTATTAGNVTLTGLEAFNNSGTVSLVNGHTGDTLTLPGTFAGSGGSTLAVDVVTGGAGSIDRLIVGGAATGSTALSLNNLTSANSGLNTGLIFATGGAGTSANAFGLANGSLDIGFINYTVASTTTAGVTSFALVGTPGDTVFRALKINEAAQNVWYKSADAVTAHLSEVRDSKWAAGTDTGAGGGRFWGIMYGGAQQRKDNNNTFSAFGVSRNVNLSYNQDAFGGQIGLDIGGTSGESAFVFGVTGGYANSELQFYNSADRTKIDAVNGGLYASFVSGNVFANALAKYDYYWLNSSSPVANFTSKYHGESYGAQGELGIRLGSDSFYAEPVVSAAYVRTDLNSPNLVNAAIDFDKFDGLRGKAGLRIGSAFDMGGSRGVVYASGNAVHEFKGRQGLDFTSNGFTLGYRNERIGTYGEGKIGFNVTTPGGVSGFVEGFGNYSKEYRGGGGRAGLRVKF